MYFFVIKCSKIVPRKNSLLELLLFLSYLKSQAYDIVHYPSVPVKFN